MSSTVTKEVAVKNILDKIKFLNNKYSRNLSFIGLKDDNWVGCKKSILQIKCNKHNTVKEITYNELIYKDKESLGCDLCSKESYVKHRCEFNIETATEEINNKINSENLDLEFLGFYDLGDSYFLNKMTQKLTIKCNKHDIIGHPILYYFLKNGYLCPECTKELNSNRLKITNREIYDELVEKDTRGYDYSSILYEDELGVDSRVITISCEKHGNFKRTLQQLRKCSEIICPDCRSTEESEESKLIYLEKINNKIIERNNNGYDLEFLGFYGDWVGSYDTPLILRCNTHDRVWTTTSCSTFVNDVVKCGCPECSALNKISISEDLCFYELSKIYNKPIIRQYSIHYYDRTLDKNRYFSVDFYLPEDNIIIEYNGAQHYLYNQFIHKEYKKFVSQVNRDLNLQKYCNDNGIKLLIIPYTNYKRISKIIETFINYGIDTTTKVYPRILPAVVENKCKDLVKWTSSS